MSNSKRTFPFHRSRGTRHSAGFTLMEVMVAVAVLGIALAAVIKAASENGANLSYMRDKTFAHWVAENKLTELHAMQEWPSAGAKNGTSELGDREWYWRREVEDTPNDNIRRVTIRVSAEEGSDDWLTVLGGFVANPALRQGSGQGPGS